MNLRQMPAAPPKKPKKVKLGLASWETPGSKAVPRVAAVEKRMAKEGPGWEERLARASEGRVQATVGSAADVWRAVDGAAGGGAFYRRPAQEPPLAVEVEGLPHPLLLRPIARSPAAFVVEVRRF